MDQHIGFRFHRFDADLLVEKEKTLEELSQTSSREPSQQPGSINGDDGAQPEVVMFDELHLGAEPLGMGVLGLNADAVVQDRGLQDIAGDLHGGVDNVNDENMDPARTRPKRVRKKVQSSEAGETNLARTTTRAKRRKRKKKAMVVDLNVIEDVILQAVNDELINEFNELQNNVAVPGLDADMEAGEEGKSFLRKIVES